MKYLFILPLIFAGTQVQANSCIKLDKCVSEVSKLTGDKYLYDTKNTKLDKLVLNEKYDLTKDNADNVISELLHIHGYTRLKQEAGHWSIVNARDIRYMPTQMIEFGKTEIPNNYDYVMVTFKLKNPHFTSEISRNFRPFMSRYGRIIDIKSSGTVIVNDTGLNVRRLAGLIELMDKEPTKEQIKEYAESKKRHHQLEILRAKNPGCTNSK